MSQSESAVVLLSGGLDSMVVAGLARAAGREVIALTIDYNQRHRIELAAAARVAATIGAVRHIVLPLDLTRFGGSALTADIAVPKDGVGPGIPATYVPARNTIFLSLALGLAEASGARSIWIGVNALDYSGYPDCRPEFVRAFQDLANLATKAGVEGAPFRIETPLLHMTKADIATQAARLGLDAGMSWSCYDPAGDRHCGRCDACRLRAKGFAEAGLPDPTLYARDRRVSGYAIKEMFVTLQGEGLQAGRRALFIRFAGCNLWSGREADRERADCTFCDTDFVGIDGDGGGRFADGAALAARARDIWAAGLEDESCRPFAVLTGGEPMLQVDAALVAAMKAEDFELAIETNGTLEVAEGIDWVCVSPKAGAAIVQRRGDEIKLVWPQPGVDYKAIEGWDFAHHLVQPMDGPNAKDAREACIQFVLRHPRWRLTLQNHKAIGLR